ncbi:hypothetical protein ABK040_015187 [Willaertia magna]
MPGAQKFNFNFQPTEEEDFDEEEEDLFGAGMPIMVRKATPEELKQIETKELAHYPPKVQQKIGVLKTLQQQYDDLENQFEEEYQKLRDKYNALYAPLIIRRQEIVTGDKEPTEEELSKVQIEVQGEKKDEEEALKGVPEFWYKVLLHSEIRSEMIQEDDLEALKYIKDIILEEFPAKPKPEKTEEKKEGEEEEDDVKYNPGFKIHFKFAENPFFTNEVLTKTYYYDEPDSEDIAISEGTEINWKEGKDLTVKVTTKKQKHKSGTRTRTVQVKEPKDSFFNFFKNLEEEMEKDEENEMFNDLLQVDGDLGETFKSSIIPYSVKYFLNVALPAEGDFSTVEGAEQMIQQALQQHQEGGEQTQQQQPECKQQ